VRKHSDTDLTICEEGGLPHDIWIADGSAERRRAFKTHHMPRYSPLGHTAFRHQLEGVVCPAHKQCRSIWFRSTKVAVGGGHEAEGDVRI